MAGRSRSVNLSAPDTDALRTEHEAVVRSLRDQIEALQRQLEEARGGIDHLTGALRRRGCCDGVTGAAHTR